MSTPIIPNSFHEPLAAVQRVLNRFAQQGVVIEGICQSPQSKCGRGVNLVGCRSARVDRNFRIVFVICEECRQFPRANTASVMVWLTKRSSF